jgi:hypothetical protein
MGDESSITRTRAVVTVKISVVVISLSISPQLKRVVEPQIVTYIKDASVNSPVDPRDIKSQQVNDKLNVPSGVSRRSTNHFSYCGFICYTKINKCLSKIDLRVWWKLERYQFPYEILLISE